MRRLFIALALAGCSTATPTESSTPPDMVVDEPSMQVDQKLPALVTVSGAVEKGPFLLGSSVSIAPSTVTENNSSPRAAADVETAAAAVVDGEAVAGQVFKTETTNDLGEFSVKLRYQGYATFEGVGFYYNEASGDLSGAQLTLRAFHAIGAADSAVNVNLLTHLTYQRIQALVGSGAEAEAAIAQAESELHVALGLDLPEPVEAGQLKVAGGDTDGNAYLFAVSTIFTQAARIDALYNSKCGTSCADAKLQELLNTASARFASDGTFPEGISAKLRSARLTIHNRTVMTALASRLSETGSTATVPDLDRVIPWEIPQSVTDCVDSIEPSVATDCKWAACGLDARPITETDQKFAQVRRERMSASECGTECWDAMRCTMDKCTTKVGTSGYRNLDERCAALECDVGQSYDSDFRPIVGRFDVDQVYDLLEWARNGECE